MSNVSTDRVYPFHYDAGHGWLKVRRSELRALGIINKISDYSYEKGGFIFLEEDCDATEFIIAKKAAGEEVKHKAVNDGDYSPIRDYRRFSR